MNVTAPRKSAPSAPAALARLKAHAASRTRFEGLLRRSRVLSSLGNDTVCEAARVAVVRQASRGECIWRYGDSAAHFQVVVSGVVKLVAPGPGLRPTIIDVFGPGEALGYWVALDGAPYIGDAMPVTERVETLLIPGSVLREAAGARPEAAGALTQAMLGHAQALRSKIAVMCAGSVQQRLAMLMLDLNTRFGDELEDGSLIVQVPLSRQDLAMWVGATIETVIRAMSRWQKDGVLETHPWGFVLRDVALLSSLLENDCQPRSWHAA